MKVRILTLCVTGLLASVGGLILPQPAPHYCPQEHPIELIGATGKTIVRKNMCGEIVYVQDLSQPPMVNVAGLDPNSTYTLFLLRQNGPHDGTYSIVWHLAHARPYGDTLTRNQSTPLPVMIHYNPPANLTANFSAIVFKENVTQGPLVSRLSAPNHYAFSPLLWVHQFHEGEMTSFTQTDFLLLAASNNTPSQGPPYSVHTVRPEPHTQPPPYPAQLPPYPAQPQPHPPYPAQPNPSYPGHPMPLPGYTTPHPNHQPSLYNQTHNHKKNSANRSISHVMVLITAFFSVFIRLI